MHKILILGPQGSGKGTQANILAEKLGIPALSMGQLLREEKASGSEMGKEIQSYLDVGELVPDVLTTAVFKKRLENDDVKNGYIIDSFPRFMEQYESSQEFFQPTAVIALTVPEEESITRMMKRAEKEQRIDDNEEAMKKRLRWSVEKTQPVIDAYQAAGICHSIDGVGTVEEIAQRIAEVLSLA